MAIFNLKAYCDESWDAHRAFVVAGYVAPATMWQEFEQSWTAALQSEGLTEFKTSDCDHGRGEFKGWTREAREGLQDRLIEIVNASALVGVWTGIDLRAYDELMPAIKAWRAQSYDDPYFLAFQQQVEAVVQLGLKTERFSKNELVGFVFDLQPEWKGRAMKIYESLKRSTSATIPWVRHLGAAAFDDSRLHPGLQAADLLAYEARRHLVEVIYGIAPKPVRPQWKRLYEARFPSGRPRLWGNYWDKPTLQFLMDNHPGWGP